MGYSLAWITDSERIVTAAYWTALICLVASVLLILLVILMRVAWLDDERRRKRVLKKWRPLMEATLRGAIPRKFPFLFRTGRLYVIEYWNKLFDTADSTQREHLITAGRRLRFGEIGLGLVDSNYLWRQLLGITTLGNLREESAWDTLYLLAQSDDTVVSLAAARALVQLRPKAATEFIVPRIVKRQGWAPARVASLLLEAGEGNVCGPLTTALQQAPEPEKVKLLHYVGVTQCPGAFAEVRRLLAQHAHDREAKSDVTSVTECLKLINSTEDVELVRPYVGHPNWHVRIQAVNALGRVGNHDDAKRLIMLLKDEHWWVRYRAAQALLKLEGASRDVVDRILQEHSEPSTQEILHHVLAEQRFA